METNMLQLYYITVKGKRNSAWMADERVKKKFLNALSKVQGYFHFTIYAFCVLDKEAYFLISTEKNADIFRTVTNMEKALEKSYQTVFVKGEERAVATWKKLQNYSASTILDYCCTIHKKSAGYAKQIQDYWWSSYPEYLNKNQSGLVKTNILLELLDSDPSRALRKFILYHRD